MSEEKKYDIWGNEIIEDSEFTEFLRQGSEAAGEAEPEVTAEEPVPVYEQPVSTAEENVPETREAAPEEPMYVNYGTSDFESVSEKLQTAEENPYAGYATSMNPQPAVRSAGYSAQEKAPKKKKKTGCIIGVLVLLLVLAAAGIGVYFFAQYVNERFSYYEEQIERAENAKPEIVPTAPQNELIKGDLNVTDEVTGTPVTVLDVSGVVDQVMPSVVCLTINLEYQSNNFFYGTTTQSSSASGSGVIIGENDDELLIVTNNHVIDDNEQAYYYTVNTTSMVVTFADGSTAEAYVKGTDVARDLAVIAVDMKDISDETKSAISVARIGDSDAAKVGNGVIAIGNALGYGQSCTVGYISALNREVKFSDGNTRTLMQVDAAINPGNSGGGLFDMYGNLIGINESKNVSQNTENMGYAIPISSVEDIITDLMNIVPRKVYNDDEKGYLGIQGSDVPSNYVSAGYPAGAIVIQIFEGGAAEASGLQLQDIITKIDDVEVASMNALMAELAYHPSGEEVTLTVERIEGNRFVTVEVPVTLGTKKAIQSAPQTQNQKEDSDLLP